MTLWPSNTAQTVSAAGYTKLARKTQVTGFVSYGVWSNDEALQPFTINPTLTQIALPRATTEADAHVFSTNLNLVSRPATDWRFSARLRRYDFDNETPQADIPQFINYDTSVKASSTGGPEPYSHARTTFDGRRDLDGAVAARADGGLHAQQQQLRATASSRARGEDTLNLTADAMGSQWVTFRAHYELRTARDGPGRAAARPDRRAAHAAPLRHRRPHAQPLHRPGGRDALRAPDPERVVRRRQGRVRRQLFRPAGGDASRSSRSLPTTSASDGLGAGASYNFERYSGFQQSRTASPGQTPDQVTDPNRDWTADSTETVHYFSIYVTPPRFGATEARLSYDYAHVEERLRLRRGAGRTSACRPRSCREVFNKLQQFKLDVRHRALQQAGGQRVLPLRAVRRLRFRVRPDGHQQHRPAELAGPRLRVSAVYCALRPLSA